MEIKYQIAERKNRVEIPKNLGFGQYFTDYIFEMDYTAEAGWHNATIKPFSKLSIDPATMFIHYGQAVFEGLKAFKTVNNEIVMFRPEKHIQRLNNSSRRVCIPEVDENFVLSAVSELVLLEKDWIPTGEGEALYLRPFIFGSDPVLGVRPSTGYKMVVILSPVGAYYPQGFKPVKILVTDEYVRAVRKGLGECKTPANYAASLLAAEEAKRIGYNQVLWLDGIEQKYIEEVGTMNIFIQFKDEVVTPQLLGSILPGVTRASVVQILKDWGMNVSERRISIDEVVSGYENGNLVGLFGTGTAAIISSVGELLYKDKKMIFNNGEPGELDLKLFNYLTGIHRGRVPDTHNWLYNVEKKQLKPLFNSI